MEVDPIASIEVRDMAQDMTKGASLKGANCAIAIVAKFYPNGDRIHWVEWTGDPMQVIELFNAAAHSLAEAVKKGPA